MARRPTLLLCALAALALLALLSWRIFVGVQGRGSGPGEDGGRASSGAAERAAGIRLPGTASPDRLPPDRIPSIPAIPEGRGGTGGSASKGHPAAGSPAPLPGTQGKEKLLGLVADPDGNPVEGATVRVAPALPGSDVPEGRSARTDRSGIFEFRGLREGTHLVSASCAGFSPFQGLEVEIPDPEPAVILLERDVPARVRTVDEEGSPLPGAKVQAQVAPSGLFLPPPAFRATTDASGEAEIRGLPASGSASVTVQASLPGRAAAELIRTVAELRAEVLQIVLERGASLQGIVVDSRGAPQGNVRLVLIPEGPAPGRPRDQRWILHSTAEGLFRFTAIPAGGFSLYADGGERGRRKVGPIRIEAGKAPEDLRVELSPPGTPEWEQGAPPPPATAVRSLLAGPVPGTGTISGRVVAAGDIPGFSIGLLPEGAPPDAAPERLFRQSGRRGEFRLRNVPAGVYQVLLIAGGRVRARARGVKVDAGAESGPVELTIGPE